MLPNIIVYVLWGRWLPLFVSPSVILAVCGDSFSLTDSLTPTVAWFKCVWAVKWPCTCPNSLVGYLPPDRMSILLPTATSLLCVQSKQCFFTQFHKLVSVNGRTVLAAFNVRNEASRGKDRLSLGIGGAAILQNLITWGWVYFNKYVCLSFLIHKKNTCTTL